MQTSSSRRLDDGTIVDELIEITPEDEGYEEMRRQAARFARFAKPDPGPDITVERPIGKRGS